MTPFGIFASVLSLWGAFLLSSKMRLGWYVALLANGAWLGWAFPREAWDIAVINVAFAAVNIRGLVVWGNK